VVWQSLMVALFTPPFALLRREWPGTADWGWFLLSGALGTAGHVCLARAFALAEMSMAQPRKLLGLVWAALLGLLVWGEVPGRTTLAGGQAIFAATTWIARREARRG
jgi:drug/metabolite transporter (DMT)-like permease